MTINNTAAISAAWFLNGITNLQQRQTTTQQQLSSGYRVQSAADSPSQVSELVNLGSSLAAYQNWSTNLSRVQAEAQTADQAIGSAISLLQQARTLGAQGDTATSTAANRQGLAAQVQSIQQQLVAVANTNTEGRYIFAGDQDQTPPYRYDSASATGVDQLASSPATRAVVNPAGETVYQSITAGQIFGPVDAGGNPAATNSFAALQSLATALGANDQAGISAALDSLNSSSDWLNQQQGYYGNAEQQIVNEQNATASQITALKTRIGGIRDTDVVQAASDLAQENIAQSAAYGAEAEIAQIKNLFSYLA
jgi:flagellar hook-associated protein 3 FlgL